MRDGDLYLYLYYLKRKSVLSCVLPLLLSHLPSPIAVLSTSIAKFVHTFPSINSPCNRWHFPTQFSLTATRTLLFLSVPCPCLSRTLTNPSTDSMLPKRRLDPGTLPVLVAVEVGEHQHPPFRPRPCLPRRLRREITFSFFQRSPRRPGGDSAWGGSSRRRAGLFGNAHDLMCSLRICLFPSWWNHIVACLRVSAIRILRRRREWLWRLGVRSAPSPRSSLLLVVSIQCHLRWSNVVALSSLARGPWW